MTTLIQRSFAGGELAPAMYARCDTSKFMAGARTIRNHYVMRHGGTANRPGTSFVGEVKDSTKVVRYLKFVFNSSQTYILEFGDLYMRVHRNGAQVAETAKNITGATQANPCVITSNAHGFSNGDEVYITGVGGMTALNGRNFKVAGVTANTFTLQYMSGVAVDSSAFVAYTSGGTASRIYTITTPYAAADVRALDFAESADVITITHPSYPVMELSRTAHTSWTLAAATFAPTVSQPDGGSCNSGVAGGSTFKYRVTAIDKDTLEESLPGFEATKAITAVTQANPCNVTANAHGYSTGDEVYITGVLGMTQLNGLKYTITKIDANNFTLGVNSTGYTAYSSGGTAARTYMRIDASGTPTSAAPHQLTWTAVANVLEYNVYKELNGVFGHIGVAGSPLFNDTNLTIDTTDTPPIARNPFAAAGDYPSTVTYVQQRRAFANSTNNPETAWLSRTGKFKNFTVSSPIQDDDAITFKMTGDQVNAVQHLLQLGKLLLFTTGGEHSADGDAAGTLKPDSINQRQHSYNGSGTLGPLIIDDTALYLQSQGSIVRDLAFNFQKDGYEGNDLTVFSAHLVDGYSIVAWAYQKIPHSIVWAVRNDGVLLGLTYVREQQILAWHRHDTDGFIEDVQAVPEGGETAVYLLVRRTISGRTVRYVERMNSRRVTAATIKDANFLDCSLSFDGRNSSATTMTLSGGTAWNNTETLTLTASVATFLASDVGNGVQLTGPDGTVLRFTIDSFTSTTVVTGRIQKTAPVSMRGVALTTWTKALMTITGLWHLEGKMVGVFADGFVVASPNNGSYPKYTVTNGSITLDKPYGVIHVGLPITADIETLDIDTIQGETLANKKILIDQLTMHLESSRGGFMGGKPPTDDTVDPLQGLTELKQRFNEDYDDPVALATDKFTVNIESSWNTNGRVFIRHVDPTPLSILAVAPSGFVPIRAGGS